LGCGSNGAATFSRPAGSGGPIFAGTAAATALAFVLHSFASGLGIGFTSFAPTWRDVSFALVLLSALYILLVALAAYSFGGYVAGRLRNPLPSGSTEEVEFRDGAHGLCTWAVATLLSALVALATAASVARVAAPSGGEAGPASSVGGENIIAMDVDRLFRSNQQRSADYELARAEAGRILLTTSSHAGLRADDRTALGRLVALQTGIAPEEVERRVGDAIVSARDNIDRARTVGVIIAFAAAAAALMGAAVAWFSACLGGEHRGEPVSLN